MKQRSSFVRMTAMAAGLALTLPLPLTPAFAQDEEEEMEEEGGAPMPGDALGVFAGSYMCRDGEHGIHLDLMVDDADDEVAQISGVLGFFPILAGKDGRSGMVSGSFVVTGTVKREDASISLEAGDWLLQPDNYGAANLEGTISRTDTGLLQITGKPVVPGMPGFCSDLIATEYLPYAEAIAEDAAEAAAEAMEQGPDE